jgi:hypothetical protein
VHVSTVAPLLGGPSDSPSGVVGAWGIASVDAQDAGAIYDARDESENAEHDGERRETVSAFVSGEGEKQQYGDEGYNRASLLKVRMIE